MALPDNHLIAVGRISGTHGIRGQLRLHSYSGNLASLQHAGEAQLALPDGSSLTVSIRRASRHSGKILLALDGYDSIDQVQQLTGAELLLRRNQLPALENDEYYWQDLLGLQVRTVDGELLGTVTGIMETGANDVYVVRNDTGKEYLIPAIADVIETVDLAAGTMTITPLEGLLDV